MTGTQHVSPWDTWHEGPCFIGHQKAEVSSSRLGVFAESTQGNQRGRGDTDRQNPPKPANGLAAARGHTGPVLWTFSDTDARNHEPSERRHVPATQSRHWQAKRRYAETHARLAAELGIKWGRG